MAARTRSGPRRGPRRRSRARAAARAGLALTVVLAGGLPALAAAAGDAPKEGDTVPVVGRDDLVGKLIPITGDPLETRSVDLRVEFRKNSAELGESAVAQLRELGAALVSEALGQVPIGVYGHTDSSGPAEFNRKLSQRRAEAVAAWLREHFTIAETRFREVRGHGEKRPREDLPHGDPAQRRVEVVTFQPPANRAPGDEPAGGAASGASEPPAPAPPQSGGSGGAGGDGVVVSVPGGGSPERMPEDEDEDDKKGGSGVIVIQ
ncbi:MAG: OmpA family protein [Immundisolibacterales bacterium]|nr:OmpA family protein [Immundisolibacterales bacterium]